MVMIKLLQGDCIERMKTLADNSVNTCVTSPPYFGLRDYGVKGQIGLEPTPDEFVQKLVKVFREVKRVLRDDGTMWLNLGDSYANNTKAGDKVFGNPAFNANRPSRANTKTAAKRVPPGLKPKDLIGIPWRVAFALQADGWYLRQDIIWHKPNPMPESVKDRCTKAHEYIFLLSKSPKYYFDNEAIKEPATYAGCNRGKSRNISPKGMTEMDNKQYDTRNKRSVWTVNTKSFKGAHFATFPPDLILPCILAGCPHEICRKCGKARETIIDRKRLKRTELPKDDPRYRPNTYSGQYASINGKADAGYTETKVVGHTDCGCGAGFAPGVVLDPFNGAGTTGLVSVQNNRDYIGIELNAEYLEMARARIEAAMPETPLNLEDIF